MGTSILLVFLAPILVVQLLFGTISEFLFGPPTEEIVLPYDEKQGIVWEYDDVDDPYLALKETKIKGDKQIFIFEREDFDVFGNLFTTPDENTYIGSAMDLVFADKNGSQKIFYAVTGGELEPSITVYDAEDCYTVEYSLQAETPKNNAWWEPVLNTAHVLAKKVSFTPTDTFTIVYFPDDSRDLSIDFAYKNAIGYLEENTGRFRVVDEELVSIIGNKEIANAVIYAIENKDAAAMEAIMCKNIKDNNDDLTKEINTLLSYIEGDIENITWKTGSSYSESHSKDNSISQNNQNYEIITSEGVYGISVVVETYNSFSSEELGIRAIALDTLIKNTEPNSSRDYIYGETLYRIFATEGVKDWHD